MSVIVLFIIYLLLFIILLLFYYCGWGMNLEKKCVCVEGREGVRGEHNIVYFTVRDKFTKIHTLANVLDSIKSYSHLSLPHNCHFC